MGDHLTSPGNSGKLPVMSDEPRADADEEPFALATPEPAAEVAPEVALVVPATAYEAIATTEATAAEAPPVAAAADLGPILEAVAALGAGLTTKFDGLQAAFEREVRAEATREKVVDRLHAELQEYKQDLLLGVLRPVFVDLIQLHDDIGKMVAAEGSPEGEVRRLLDTMASFQQAIEDILYRQGVEPFVQESAGFDPRRQRAIATVPTDDPNLARTIAVRHRKGFQTQNGDRVIRPEVVSVYALKR
jgi:molecular chaperone GrpE